MQYKTLAIIFLIVGFMASNLYSKEIFLYGGKDNKIYLGCITCSKFNSESIWNAYGQYGSSFSSTSIWNNYSSYGSEYSSYSPWNSYSSESPILVDNQGNFYGYFTTNEYKSQRTRNEWFLEILDNWKWIMENFDKYIENLD